jgi:hypothetical protein
MYSMFVAAPGAPTDGEGMPDKGIGAGDSVRWATGMIDGAGMPIPVAYAAVVVEPIVPWRLGSPCSNRVCQLGQA